MRHYFFILTLLFLASCEKNTEKKIAYEASGAISEYKLNYTDESGNLVTTTIHPESIEDVWRYTFTGEEGDIVYLSGIYKDVNSALRLSIMIDGKIYKEGYSIGDTIKYLTVSGVIPYE